jgi:hypothetical protein
VDKPQHVKFNNPKWKEREKKREDNGNPALGKIHQELL